LPGGASVIIKRPRSSNVVRRARLIYRSCFICIRPNRFQILPSADSECLHRIARDPFRLNDSFSPYLVGHGSWSRRRIASERAANFLIFSATAGILRVDPFTRARSSSWMSRYGITIGNCKECNGTGQRRCDVCGSTGEVEPANSNYSATIAKA
jgi:hypothetical protein